MQNRKRLSTRSHLRTSRDVRNHGKQAGITVYMPKGTTLNETVETRSYDKKLFFMVNFPEFLGSPMYSTISKLMNLSVTFHDHPFEYHCLHIWLLVTMHWDEIMWFVSQLPPPPPSCYCAQHSQLSPALFHYVRLTTNTYGTAYLLTHSMEQSPSLEANLFSATQEIPLILRNPKIRYRSHKCLPPVSILSQLDPVHIAHIPLPEDPF